MIQTGQVLNDTYEIIERLGSGSGGIIFKAYHKRMKKYVAIKLIKDEFKNAVNTRSEVDMLKDLKHEFLPLVIDFVEDGDDVYTVMEFIEGNDLKRIVESGRRFDEYSVRKYALQLCDAVGYLHGHNPPIIHSDIKPSNIMLTIGDNICLIDFNISTMTNNGIAESIGGSSGYAAPEQFRKVIAVPASVDEFHEETRFMTERETEILDSSRSTNTLKAYIDIRTDIYGIGASLYYILTGRVPNGEMLDFSGARCSAGMKSVIKKCMAADPDKRFKNVQELCSALKIRTGKMPVIIGASSVMAAALVVLIVALATDDNTSGDIETDVIVSKTTASVTTVSETKAVLVAVTTNAPVTTAKPVVTTAPPATIAKTTTNTTTVVTENRPAKVKIGEKEYDTSLKELDLSGLKLTNKDIEPLKYFTNLEVLKLGAKGFVKNKISSIKVLSGLTNLKKLYLSDNNIKNISALSNLTNLETLDLSNNAISSIDALSGLTEIWSLRLDHNSISDINALSEAFNLRGLYLDSNEISDISALSGLTGLWELSLADNSINSIESLSGLNSLSFLDLSNNNISDINPLKYDSDIATLSLSSNNISDISPIYSMIKLMSLDIKDNNISTNDINNLLLTLEKCDITY